MTKHLILSLALAAGLTAAAQRVDVDAMAHYTYPDNSAASASLNFMPDGQTYLQLSADGKRIDQFSVETGKQIATIVDVSKTRGDQKLDYIADYTVSPDGSLLLLYQEKQQVYRRTFRARYFIYAIGRNTLKPLSTNHEWQQAPTVSPDARMIAFMAPDNNIYVHKVDYGSEVAVTTDGKPNHTINGVPDWTYEEEFSTSRSMEWAPDNSMLCYLKYDESQVPAYTLAQYEGACDARPEFALYPGQFTYKYPVAGEKNSRVSLHSYDVETRKTKDIALDAADIEYIPRIHFGPTASTLIALTLNRDQNRLDFWAVNPRSTVSTRIHQENSQAWVRPECYQDVSYEADGMVIFSDRSGWSHLYRLGYAGQDLGALTRGDFDVTDYCGAAPDGSFFYQAAAPSPIDRTLTRVDRKGKASAIGKANGWNWLTMAPGGTHYILGHSSATEVPVYSLVASAKGKTLRVLEDNAALAEKYASAPRKEFFTFTNDAGQELNAWLIKPVGFDPAGGKKYPVIVYQYSGPGSQEVANRWGIDWMQRFAEEGYAVACVDGRGTGGRGRAFEQCVYKNLGHYETLDQNALLAHLQAQPWVDAKRVGIFGWSYGGYEALMAASSGAPWAAACAVAPVTSWRLYDTIYAERYMSTPRANPDGYKRSAPLGRADALRCPVLLMHGTADDNVHPANTMELAARMINANRWPQMLIFPNKNHSIYGCGARAVVYARMLEFFNSELLGK